MLLALPALSQGRGRGRGPFCRRFPRGLPRRWSITAGSTSRRRFSCFSSSPALGASVALQSRIRSAGWAAACGLLRRDDVRHEGDVGHHIRRDGRRARFDAIRSKAVKPRKCAAAAVLSGEYRPRHPRRGRHGGAFLFLLFDSPEGCSRFDPRLPRLFCQGQPAGSSRPSGLVLFWTAKLF